MRWLVLLLVVTSVSAQTTSQVDDAPVWHFSLAVGYGEYGAIRHGEEDHAFYLLPRWSYYNGRFYVENLDVGWNLLESSNWSWDLTGKQSFDALLFRQHSLRDSLFRGVAENNPPLGIPWDSDPATVLHPSTRHFSYLAGTTLFWRNEHWQASSAWHHDISSVHNGIEVNHDLRYRYTLDDVNFAVTGAIRWLDARYSNYYFGFNEADSSNVYLYQPGAQWLPSLKLETSWSLSEHCRLLFSVKREWLSTDIHQSVYFSSRRHDIWFSGILVTW